MIKLFYCEKCGKDFDTPYCRGVEGNVTLKLDNCGILAGWQGQYYLTIDGQLDIDPAQIDNPKCIEHGTHVELRELEKYPHIWDNCGTYRRCQICGFEQKAKVTYDKL